MGGSVRTRAITSILLVAVAVCAAAGERPPDPLQARSRLDAAQVEYTEARFLAAVRDGEVDNVKLFLAAGMSPDTTTPDRRPAIGLAVVEHQNEVLKVLLDAGAKPADESWSASPLFLARLSANAGAEALLARRGATLLPREVAVQKLVQVRSGVGKKQIMDAIERGRTEVVALQIQAGMDVNVDLFDGNTPLHVAAANGRADIAKLLIQAGADVNARNRAGTPVIGYAIVRKHEDVVQLLTDAGAQE